MHITRGTADPALDQSLGLLRLLCQHAFAHLLYGRQQMGITRKISDTETELTRLTGAEYFAGATQFQILLGDAKTIVGFAHHLQPLSRQLAQRRLIEEHAI